MQPPQLAARARRRSPHERGPKPAVEAPGRRPGVGAIQREHQLAVQALAERMRHDQRLQLADELAVPAGVEVGVDRQLERAQP